MSQPLINTFQTQFGTSPDYLVRAPGRVNLIGEHTDYNDGYVMPIAINREIQILLSPSSTPEITLYSVNFDETLTFNLNGIERSSDTWGEYVKGVAWTLMDAGHTLVGWKGVIYGDLPVGAGLSSSAAVEVAAVKAFEVASGISLNRRAIAQIARQTEQDWIEVNCGIMDPLISVFGLKRHASLIDCQSLELEQIPLPPDCLIAILDTSTRRELIGSDYNTRQSQCAAVAKALNRQTLRDLSEKALSQNANSLDPTLLKRARHVLTENRRTLAAAEAMREKNPGRLGELIYESHLSLRDDFEVSTPELNLIVEIARQHRRCFGARMTGAGFGGCAVAIIQSEAASAFVEEVSKTYLKASGLHASVYLTPAVEGSNATRVR